MAIIERRPKKRQRVDRRRWESKASRGVEAGQVLDTDDDNEDNDADADTDDVR